MKTLEFENTQGINMQFVAATVLERGFAWLIDAIIVGLYFSIMAIVLSPSTDNEGLFYTVAVILPPFFFYTVLMEWLNDGRSIGKMVLGLKVVRVDGRPVAGYDYLMRWMFRWLDIYMTLGTLGSVMVSATSRSQRLGDVLADTTVIQTRSGRISLKRVLRLGSLTKYEPKFPQVLLLTEEQMMLVKEVMNRNRKIKTLGNHRALAETADRLRLILDIDSKLGDKALLETLMKDYVTLSR